ncbi:hypothetical protein BCL69_100829 [Nitrosomonas communis]|uniref:Uncharacterized protein n=1 Tax=Nitrosomonas communis TaxID=44574 RepID=A0A5D3YE44_9PROT|nr:hypothetical protein BCL69_100829 [Nitrosomonas communis]
MHGKFTAARKNDHAEKETKQMASVGTSPIHPALEGAEACHKPDLCFPIHSSVVISAVSRIQLDQLRSQQKK